MRDDFMPGFWEEVMQSGWLEPVELLSAGAAVTDGRTAYAAHPTRALAAEAGTLSGDSAGNRKTIRKMVFFLPPGAPAPRPGDRLRYQGRLFDLKEVRICKDVSGAVAAYRCQSF